MSRTHFLRKFIPGQYEIVKQTMVRSVSATDCCALTSDLWTGCHNHAYISLTAHFIDSASMEMKNYCFDNQRSSWQPYNHKLGWSTSNCSQRLELWWESLWILYRQLSKHWKCRKWPSKSIALASFGHTLQLSVLKAFNLNGCFGKST